MLKKFVILVISSYSFSSIPTLSHFPRFPFQLVGFVASRPFSITDFFIRIETYLFIFISLKICLIFFGFSKNSGNFNDCFSDSVFHYYSYIYQFLELFYQCNCDIEIHIYLFYMIYICCSIYYNFYYLFTALSSIDVSSQLSISRSNITVFGIRVISLVDSVSFNLGVNLAENVSSTP